MLIRPRPAAEVALAVSEVVERHALVELLSYGSEEFEGAFETRDRVLPVSHRMPDESGAVPGDRFTKPVAELVQSFLRLRARDERVRVPAEAGLAPADAVERVGLPDLVTSLVRTVAEIPASAPTLPRTVRTPRRGHQCCCGSPPGSLRHRPP